MKNNIQLIIEKYFEGKTTLEEEQLLKNYFQNEDISEEHLPYLSYFQFLENEQNIKLSDDFETQLFKKIEANESRGKIRNLRFKIVRIAAAFLLLMAAWFAFEEITRPKEIDWAKYEIKDPQKAFETTKAALTFASKKLNSGTNKAAKQTKNLSRIKFNYRD